MPTPAIPFRGSAKVPDTFFLLQDRDGYVPPYQAGTDAREERIGPMKYLLEVFWTDEEGHIAVVSDLPGCSAFGETPEAAVQEIGDATPEPTTKTRRAA